MVDVTSFIQVLQYANYEKKKTYINFQTITNWPRLERKHGIRKTYKIDKSLTFLFRTFIASNKIPWYFQSLL